jgi:hypothetical protein
MGILIFSIKMMMMNISTKNFEKFLVFCLLLFSVQV